MGRDRDLSGVSGMQTMPKHLCHGFHKIIVHLNIVKSKKKKSKTLPSTVAKVDITLYT
jgi:hypothetical protein